MNNTTHTQISEPRHFVGLFIGAVVAPIVALATGTPCLTAVLLFTAYDRIFAARISGSTGDIVDILAAIVITYLCYQDAWLVVAFSGSYLVVSAVLNGIVMTDKLRRMRAQ